MPRPKKSANRKSPYVRYSKAPYPYSFKSCKHTNSSFQSTPNWSGKCCASCNTIMATHTTGNDTRPSR